MSGVPTPKNSIANAVKIYLFPSLATILAMMIWRDVTELRSDVKQLLAQSNIDKTEIQNLKKDVDILNRQVFKAPLISQTSENNHDLSFMRIFHDEFFKPEEVFDINKYIPKI